MYKSSSAPTVRPKKRVEVEVTLSNSETIRGFFFTLSDQRLLDLLNDERPFLPFETTGGRILVLSKSKIVTLDPVDQEAKKHDKPPSWIGQ